MIYHNPQEWGRQPEPVFTPWGHRPPRPYQSRRQRDAEAIAAAQAKRERKAAKRLREQT